MLIQRQEIIVQALNAVDPHFVGEAALPFMKCRRRIERLYRRSHGQNGRQIGDEWVAAVFGQLEFLGGARQLRWPVSDN